MGLNDGIQQDVHTKSMNDKQNRKEKLRQVIYNPKAPALKN